MKTAKIKKTFMSASMALLIAGGLFVGIESINDTAFAEESTTEETIAFTETKLNISNDGNKLLMVTAINNTEYLKNVSALGYTIDGYTVSDEDFTDTDKYYSAITIGSTTQTAKDIFGEKANQDAKLLIWEIGYSANSIYNITAYATVHNGDKEQTINGTTRTLFEGEIIYHLNGGTGEAYGTFKFGKGLAELPVPTKAGMTFEGWYDNSSLTGEKVTGISADQKEKVELWAKYTHNTYSVTIDKTAAQNVTFNGEENAVHGTDYTFTVSLTKDQPLSIVVTAGENVIPFTDNGNGTYTVSGDDITDNLHIVLEFTHIWVQTTAADHVVYGQDTTAEKNKLYTFAVSAETGYKIKSVSVSDTEGVLNVTDNGDGTYSVLVKDNAITISAEAEEISYTLKLAYGNDVNTSLGTHTYTESITLLSVSQITGFELPEHYEFLGWALQADGEAVYQDGASVSRLTTQDGATITLYAVVRGEAYTVEAGELKYIEFADGQEMTAHYGEDFVFSLKDCEGYYLNLNVTIGGRSVSAEYDGDTNTYKITKENVNGNITIAGEKFVADPALFENVKNHIEIADVYGNNNSYDAIAVLKSDGIYFRASVKQNSITNDAALSEQNLVFVDSIRFVFGKKGGSALHAVPNNDYYFGVNVCGRVQNLDRGLAKVTGAAGNYTIVYEGFVSYEKLIALDVLGYTAEDFAGTAYQSAQVYCGLRILNHKNMTSAADAVFTPNAQNGYSNLEIVSADGTNDVKGNLNIIDKDGITSLVVTDEIDGIIAENEYGKYSLVYNDTDTNRANKLEVFGKKTAEGLRIAVRVTSKTVVYYNGKPSGIHDVIDHVMLSYRNANGSMVNLFLHADGRMSGYTDKGKVVALISRIDKSAAGNTTIAKKNNAAALVAEAGHHLVTTYELLIPYGFENGILEDDSANGEVYVRFRHRYDQAGDADSIAYSGKNPSGGTTWEFTNGANVTWPNDWANKVNMLVDSNGIFDMRRTLKFDNTAAGNTNQVIEDKEVVVGANVQLPTGITAAVGYRFIGWALTADGDVLESIESLPMSWIDSDSGCIILYARYEEAVYNVTISDDDNLIKESTGAENGKVKLGQDYVITLKENDTATTHKVNTIEITIGGVPYIPEVNGNVYTIKGKDINGDVVITAKQVDAVSHNVTFASDSWATFTGDSKAYKGVGYTFTVKGDLISIIATCDGKSIPVNEISSGTYMIDSKYIIGDIQISAKEPVVAPENVIFEYHRNEGEELHLYTSGLLTAKNNTVVKVTIDGRSVENVATFDSASSGFRIDTHNFGISVGDSIHTILIETEEVIYKQTFKFVTMVVMNVDEFKLIQTQYYQGVKENRGYGTEKTSNADAFRDGYFVLGADINKGGEYFDFTMAPVGFNDDGHGLGIDKKIGVSWYGIIDGQGHTVYNVTSGYGGMFGMLPSTSVIKNIAIVGAKANTTGKIFTKEGKIQYATFEAALKTNKSGTYAANCGFLTRGLDGGTIENVYIEVAEMPAFGRYGVLAFGMQNKTVLKNIVINIKTCVGGSASDRHAAVGINWGSTCSNVFAYGAINASYGNGSGEKPYLGRSAITGISGSTSLSATFANLINGKGSFTVTGGKLYFGTYECDSVLSE